LEPSICEGRGCRRFPPAVDDSEHGRRVAGYCVKAFGFEAPTHPLVDDRMGRQDVRHQFARMRNCEPFSAARTPQDD